MSTRAELRQLRALAAAYLRMSLRGKAASTFVRRRPGKWRGTLALALLYAAIGTVAAIGASGSRNPFSFALVLHTVTFVMLGMSQAAESGDLLFRPGEHEVLGHLPIAGRMLLAAKALSLTAYALLLALAINVPAIAVASRLGWMHPAFVRGHFGATVLLAAFSTSLLVFTYGLVVRFVDRERLDGLAAWSQAALSAAFLALSQGLAHVVELPIVRLESSFCLAFLPAWFAALDILAIGEGSRARSVSRCSRCSRPRGSRRSRSRASRRRMPRPCGASARPARSARSHAPDAARWSAWSAGGCATRWSVQRSASRRRTCAATGRSARGSTRPSGSSC
jgi:hypothetical protein